MADKVWEHKKKGKVWKLIEKLTHENRALRNTVDETSVRVGADYNSSCTPSEIVRVDLDTEDGTYCICVEKLGSRGVIVVDVFPENDPSFFGRVRVAEFKA